MPQRRCSVALLLTLVVLAYQARSSSGEQQGCSFVLRPDAAQWDCAAVAAAVGQPLQDWTQADAAKFAVAHAPIIYMHPAEAYLLTDPRTYWRGAHLYSQFYKRMNKTAAILEATVSGSARGGGGSAGARGAHAQLAGAAAGNRSAGPGGRAGGCDLAAAERLAWSFISILPTDPEQALLPAQRKLVQGSPIDDQGRSTARVFYQLLQHKGAWVYTYNLYYAWNGCNNQAFMTSAGGWHKRHTLEYIACPDGVHESDWERVAIAVCPTAGGGTPVAALLSQHNHDQLLNCTPGARGPSAQCNWHFGADRKAHLVVYAALHSHANFPQPSNATICGEVTNRQDAVFFLDRTSEGGPVFEPADSNIVPLPGTLPDQTTDPEDWAWSHYPGWWGAAEWKLPAPSVMCLSKSRTQKAACPDTPAWRMVAAQYGLPASQREPPAPDDAVLQPFLQLPADAQAIMPFDYHAKGGAKQGPLFRPWAHHWAGAKLPPLYQLPAGSLAYRLLLNGGSAQPALECFPPMQADPEWPREMPLVVRSDPWGPLLLLLAVPLTLGTAAVVQSFLLKATLPGGANPGGGLAWDSPGGSGGAAAAAWSAGLLINEAGSGWRGGAAGARGRQALGGWWGTAVGQLWPWGAAASRAGYREVEMGEVADDRGSGKQGRWGWFRRAPGDGNSAYAAAGSRAHRGLFQQPDALAAGQGCRGCVRAAWGACMACCLVRTRRGRWRLQRPGWLGLLASTLAWVLYAWGLWASFGVIHVSLAVLAPLFDALHWVWQALAAMLFVYDMLMRTVFARKASAGSSSLGGLGGTSGGTGLQGTGVPVWAQRLGEGEEHGVLNFLPDEEDNEEDVRRLVGPGALRSAHSPALHMPPPPAANGGAGEITAAVALAGAAPCGPAHPGWFGAAAGQARPWMSAARASTQALGTALASTLLAFSLMMALVQGMVQVACGVVVFSRVALTVPTTAAGVVGPSGEVVQVHHHPHPGALGHWSHGPVGATVGVENPARLYAGSLCLRWRDEVGVAALIMGAIIWAVQHVVFRSPAPPLSASRTS